MVPSEEPLRVANRVRADEEISDEVLADTQRASTRLAAASCARSATRTLRARLALAAVLPPSAPSMAQCVNVRPNQSYPGGFEVAVQAIL